MPFCRFVRMFASAGGSLNKTVQPKRPRTQLVRTGRRRSSGGQTSLQVPLHYLLKSCLHHRTLTSSRRQYPPAWGAAPSVSLSTLAPSVSYRTSKSSVSPVPFPGAPYAVLQRDPRAQPEFCRALRCWHVAQCRCSRAPPGAQCGSLPPAPRPSTRSAPGPRSRFHAATQRYRGAPFTAKQNGP